MRYSIFNGLFVVFFCVIFCGDLPAQYNQKIYFKNINSNKPITLALGYRLNIENGLFGKIFKKKQEDIYFISSRTTRLEPQKSLELTALPANINAQCPNLTKCSLLEEFFDAEALSRLKEQLAKNKGQKSELRPVIVASWNADLFSSDEGLSTKKTLLDTGAYVLDLSDDVKKSARFYLDVVEWMDVGTNLQGGFKNTVEKWERLKKPPYIQVINYDREFITQEITVTSYATYPVYVGIISCEVDVTSLHEARNCAFLKDSQAQALPIYQIDKNKKQEISLNVDIRSIEYFSQRPKAYSKEGNNNPYQVYLMASPFKEDIDQSPRKPNHTISAMRNALTNTRYHRVASRNIFSGDYRNFYIYQNNKGISFFVGDYVATDLTAKLLNKLTSIASPWGGSLLPVGGQYVDNMMRYLRDSIDQNVVQVIDRTNAQDALSESEKKSVTQIKETILKGIKESEQKQLTHYVPKTLDLADIKAEMIPNVAFAPSGGGYRAALATLGLKKALNDNNVDPLFLYQAGLSGSTWYFSKLLHMAQNDWAHKGKSGHRLLDQSFYRKLGNDIRLRPQYNSEITNFLSFPNFEKEHGQLLAFFAPMLVRWAFLQDLTLVDLMGAGLWYNLFRDVYPFDLKLSGFQDLMKSGQVPFTLMTAVTKTPAMDENDYLWFEFSPFEIGATIFDRFVPTQSFGRFFYKGHSITTSPELTLPFFMGMWGSAMSAGILDGMRQEVLPKNLKIGAELPFLADMIDFVKLDYPAISTLAQVMTKYELDKSDTRELLKFAIKYVDKLAFNELQSCNKISLERIKLRLLETEKRLNELPVGQQGFDINQLSWLYEEEVKALATSLYALQPDRVDFISKKLINAQKISELQAFSGAIVGNPYNQMDFAGNILKDLPTIELRDGGVDFNIPFPPLVKNARGMDIIVAFDASPDVNEKVKALQNGCLYAKRHKIKRFPIEECLALFKEPAKKAQLNKDIFTIIGDPDSLEKMTIIYIPLKIITSENYEEVKGILKKDYSRYINWDPHNDITGTMNLRYKPEQVDELSGFAELLGEVVSPAIKDVFERKLRNKINAQSL